MGIAFNLALTAALSAGLGLPEAANAQAGGSRQQLTQMFDDISRKTNWDMSKDMLWGYFFTNNSRDALDVAAQLLSQSGYRVVAIYLSEKKATAAPDLWWLHVERIETHSIESLLKRNAELAAFARTQGLNSYDGMDVGPVASAKR